VAVQPSACANQQPRRRTILLVEDEPFVLDATSRILESAGFEVLPATNAQEAITIFQERNNGSKAHTGRIDLVMTDMVLPGRSGQQLGQHLRQHSSDLNVLLTSGYANPEFEGEAPESRTFFLPKPYSKRILTDKIEQILASQFLQRSATQTR
jgi:two-component system, cell cycle sensor histidine kinase and response regulator CckA